MIKLENTVVSGFESAIRGMRNPLNSWENSDSYVTGAEIASEFIPHDFFVGENDLALMRKLFAAGSDHRKFLRFIDVTADIVAPLYWWKEYDTYKVGTVANSCSTMHKIADKRFTVEDFSFERTLPMCNPIIDKVIGLLNQLRAGYTNFDDLDEETKKLCERKDFWNSMIQMLPSSYNQRRTIHTNYEVLVNQFFARREHKLNEWVEYCDWIRSLPYFEAIFLNETE